MSGATNSAALWDIETESQRRNRIRWAAAVSGERDDRAPRIWRHVEDDER